MTKKIFVLSGEASGDLHAANLVHEMKRIQPNLVLQGWGGDRLQQEGVVIKKHIRELAFMGFLEVVLNLKTILKNFKICKNEILDFQPNVLILVDYPGFNLRIAEWAKTQNIRVFYYVSPQIWAWKKNRVFKIKKSVERMYCILPFEKDFYKQFEIDVNYLGHPLLDEVHHFRTKYYEDLPNFQKPILAILPGSRKQEIERKLPIMLEAAKQFPHYHILVACAPNLDLSYYDKYKVEGVDFIQNKTYSILNIANLAIVTSGTATLETALFRVPQVVCYKSSPASYWIARSLIHIKYISLVNLILDKAAVKELIQADCSVQKIVTELGKIEEGKEGRSKMIKDYDNLVQLLGENGASARIAENMLQNL